MGKRRLTHSTRGFMRRVQIAHRDSIFIITEGKKTDRWLYDGTLRKSAPLAEFGIQYYPIESIATDGASGKIAVIKMFKRLRAAGKLIVQNSTGRKHTFFFVDADHDHVTLRRLRSNHLIYTELPDAEAHILDECDFVEVVANVASLPIDEATLVVQAFGPWQENLAKGWRDWFVLCCLGSLLGLSNCPSPGTPPNSTSGRMGPVRQQAIDALRASLMAQIGANPGLLAKWTRYERRLDRRIDKLMNDGVFLAILKGKWCTKRLKHLIEAYGPTIAGYDITVAEDSILSAAKAHCEFSKPWHQSVRRRVETVVLQP